MRLNSFISTAGFCSRRKADELIAAGRVTVNGQKATVGLQVSTGDTVCVDKKPIVRKQSARTIMLHKPIGTVSSCVRQEEEETLFDIVRVQERLFPVGRLDKDSSGLILLTNNGDLAQRLTHPKYEHEKEYIVTTEGELKNTQLNALRRGIMLDEKRRTPRSVSRISDTSISIVLTEGRKRHIRRMIGAVGNSVASLQRVRVGNLKLGNLAPGNYRDLTEAEVNSLLGDAPMGTTNT